MQHRAEKIAVQREARLRKLNRARCRQKRAEASGRSSLRQERLQQDALSHQQRRANQQRQERLDPAIRYHSGGFRVVPRVPWNPSFMKVFIYTVEPRLSEHLGSWAHSDNKYSDNQNGHAR